MAKPERIKMPRRQIDINVQGFDPRRAADRAKKLLAQQRTKTEAQEPVEEVGLAQEDIIVLGDPDKAPPKAPGDPAFGFVL